VWSASLPGRFTPRERAPGKNWLGDLAGPIADLDIIISYIQKNAKHLKGKGHFGNFLVLTKTDLHGLRI
jgi:hypothetical protein